MLAYPIFFNFASRFVHFQKHKTMRTLFIIFFFLTSGNLFAQRALESTLLDIATSKPVAGAHVYLDGTNIGTTTDSLGKFRISVNNLVNSSLVISHVLYESIIISDPFREALPEIIYLKEDFSEMDEVVISAKTDKKKRREMLFVFRNQLLGNTHLGRIKIKNEDDIVLIHDKEQQTLSAYTRKPLEIQNYYLKYDILLYLNAFQIRYTGETFHSNSFQNVLYSGTFYFTDIGSNSKSLNKRRQEIYKSSVRNFFHLLAQNKMKVDALTHKPNDVSSFHVFELYDKYIKLVNPEKYFIVKEVPNDPSLKNTIIRPEMKDSVTGNLSIYVIDEETLKLMTLGNL